MVIKRDATCLDRFEVEMFTQEIKEDDTFRDMRLRNMRLRNIRLWNIRLWNIRLRKGIAHFGKFAGVREKNSSFNLVSSSTFEIVFLS